MRFPVELLTGISKRCVKPECKWRLIEEFGTDCFEEQEDGMLLFHADYTDAENLLIWLLTFRDKVILLEPKELWRELVDFSKAGRISIG